MDKLKDDIEMSFSCDKCFEQIFRVPKVYQENCPCLCYNYNMYSSEFNISVRCQNYKYSYKYTFAGFPQNKG